MTVDEMLERITSDEIAEWMAIFIMENEEREFEQMKNGLTG